MGLWNGNPVFIMLRANLQATYVHRIRWSVSLFSFSFYFLFSRVWKSRVTNTLVLEYVYKVWLRLSITQSSCIYNWLINNKFILRGNLIYEMRSVPSFFCSWGRGYFKICFKNTRACSIIFFKVAFRFLRFSHKTLNVTSKPKK